MVIPRLYCLSSFQNMPIYHFYSFEGTLISWNLHFLHNVDGREIDELATLLHLLDSATDELCMGEGWTISGNAAWPLPSQIRKEISVLLNCCERSERFGRQCR